MNRLNHHYQKLSRAAAMLLVMLLSMTAQTTWAQEVSTSSFTITKVVTPTGGGSINVSSSNTGSPSITSSEQGSRVYFTVTPNTGYKIKSWSVKNDATSSPIDIPAPASIDLYSPCSFSFSMPLANVTITATFEATPRTVTFYANGGTGTMNEHPFTDGYNYTIPACRFTRENYVFLGWATSADGDVVYQPGDKVTLNADLALYAKWGFSDGSAEYPYLIKTKEDLDNLASQVNGGNSYEGKYFKLMNDISFSRTSSWNSNAFQENNFTSIGSPTFVDGVWNSREFSGSFDGGGHTISGIRIYKGGTSEADSEQGLFGLLGKGGTVKNLTLADARITGPTDVGGIVGINKGTIENCHVKSNVALHAVVSCADSYGGIVGVNWGTVSHCSSAATLSLGNGASVKNYGGIAGISYGPLRDNLAIRVTIPAGNYRGAIAGYCDNLQRNYYSGCSVGDATSGIGCGGAGNSANLADVNGNDGAVPAIILSETQTAMPAMASGDKVVFRREFTKDKASTVCLPFGIDATQAAAAGKFYTFVGVDMANWEVIMQETDPSNLVSGALTANTPYLFKPAATGPVLFHGEAAATATAGTTTEGEWEFRGTYEKQTWDSGQTRLYGFAAADFTVDGQAISKDEIGSFRRYNSGYCDAFRCYLWAPESVSPARGATRTSQLPESMRVRLLGADGKATGIRPTPSSSMNEGEWYDLSGRKLSGKPTKKGIYIHHGQTLIIK